MYLDIDSLKKDLEKLSKNFDIADLLKWKASSWAQVIAMAAGLNPFGEAVRALTPAAFLPLIPKIEYVVSKAEQKIAKKTLKNGLRLVNDTILEATKQMYQNVCQYAGGIEIPGFENLMVDLSNDLFDPAKRAEYFNAGAGMMSPEESWTGKHHLLGVHILTVLKTCDKINSQDFMKLAEQLNLTQKGKAVFNPFEKISAPQQPKLLDSLSQTLNKVFKKS